MKAINQTKFKQAYDISDENFINFLDDRNCATFKSLSKYCDKNIISKNSKVIYLYHKLRI